MVGRQTRDAERGTAPHLPLSEDALLGGVQVPWAHVVLWAWALDAVSVRYLGTSEVCPTVRDRTHFIMYLLPIGTGALTLCCSRR